MISMKFKFRNDQELFNMRESRGLSLSPPFLTFQNMRHVYIRKMLDGCTFDGILSNKSNTVILKIEIEIFSVSFILTRMANSSGVFVCCNF